MRTIKEILVIIKEEFNIRYYNGLCNTTYNLCIKNKITYDEYLLWKDYWEDYAKTQMVFYYYAGDKTLDNTYWAWRVGLKKPRNNWLDKHIKLNK